MKLINIDWNGRVYVRMRRYSTAGLGEVRFAGATLSDSFVEARKRSDILITNSEYRSTCPRKAACCVRRRRF